MVIFKKDPGKPGPFLCNAQTAAGYRYDVAPQQSADISCLHCKCIAFFEIKQEKPGEIFTRLYNLTKTVNHSSLF